MRLSQVAGQRGRRVVAEPSTKAKAWAIFDWIVAEAMIDGEYTNPWRIRDDESIYYEPDFATLVRLLGVPLHLRAKTTTGVPALALDVWVSYELRRAGFDPDAVWPRAEPPRIVPAPIANLLKLRWNKSGKDAVRKRVMTATPPKGVVASSASILGKNYLKQVDVVMSDWITGPEILISTKRMDSSFGKNAANRVEESYGDAKNLRLRHPMAALGFVYGLRSTILEKEKDKADWLIDLLQKLGREDDAYHAVTLIMMEYSDAVAVKESADDLDPGEDAMLGAGISGGLGEDWGDPDDEELFHEAVETSAVQDALANLPAVKIAHEEVPEALQPSRFFQLVVGRVLDATPINMHVAARERLRSPVPIYVDRS